MRTKEKIIELIREGKLVLDIDGFKGTQTATDVFNEIRKFTWVANYRYYGVDADGIFVALFAYELNNREIVTLQEYLDSPSLSEVDKFLKDNPEWCFVDGNLYKRTGTKTGWISEDEEISGFRNPTKEEVDQLSNKRGAVIYLGKHKWNDAIDYAMTLGLFLPSYEKMTELVKHFKSDTNYCQVDTYWSSTKYLSDVSCARTFPEQEDRTSKETELAVYGITDMTKEDIKLGNFDIYHSVKEWIDSLSKEDQTLQGSREYDEKLLDDYMEWYWEEDLSCISIDESKKDAKKNYQLFLNSRYNSDLLKEKEQLEQRLSEINKQLK